jgi:hypothetical protein
MTIAERNQLLEDSLPEDPDKLTSRRFALRRGSEGLEWFEGRLTRCEEDEAEFHGYPTGNVPAKVLRRFREQGKLSEAEYRKMIRELG